MIVESELFSVVGPKVMLTLNLCIDVGLVISAIRVKQIVYNYKCFSPWPPIYVLVRFDNYVGVP